MNEKRKSGKLSSKERRSSFSKLKTLFTARPEPETTGNKLNGKKLKSRSSKGINDVSTMSQPFYNPGIDDLTIVKVSLNWFPKLKETFAFLDTVFV